MKDNQGRSNPTLHVVGPSWLAEDLLVPDVNVIADPGLEMPEDPAAFWCSGSHYARLVSTGWGSRFTSSGGMYPIQRISNDRNIEIVPLGAIANGQHKPTGTTFAKPNDLKLPDTFPACLRTPAEMVELAQSLVQSRPLLASLPTVLQSPLELGQEVRFVIGNHHEVLVATTYVTGDGRLGRDAADLPVPSMAVVCARHAAVEMNHRAPMPAAWVLDVARTSDGDWIPLETNPVASSGWFDPSPNERTRRALVGAILSGQGPNSGLDTWWDPLVFCRTAPLPTS